MRCEEARTIANHLLDGDEHLMEAEARSHIQCCDACSNWYAEMLRVTNLLSAVAESLPEVDVAESVMRRLPAHHPAAEPTRKTWIPRRVLAIAGVSWLLGALVMLLLGSGLLLWLRSERGGQAVVETYGIYRSTGAVVNNACSHISAAARSCMSVVENSVPAPRGLGILFMGFAFVDCVLLLVILAAWRLWPRNLRGVRILV